MKYAILLHLIDWDANIDEIVLSKGIRLCKTEGSNAGNLYRRIYLSHGIDDAEPFDYKVHFLIEGHKHSNFMDYQGAYYSISSRLCNIVSICTFSPLGMCRIISSNDNFKSSVYTDIISTHTPVTEFFLDKWISLDTQKLEEIKKNAGIWRIVFGKEKRSNAD